MPSLPKLVACIRACREDRGQGLWAMLPSIFCCIPENGSPEKVPSDRSISQAIAATTNNHFAFNYLATMRSSFGIRHHVIDRNGNFKALHANFPNSSCSQQDVVHADTSWGHAMQTWEDEWKDCEYNSSLLQKWLLCSSGFVFLSTLATALTPPGNNPEDCFAGSFTVRGYRWFAYSPFFLIPALLLLARFAIGRIPEGKIASMYPALLIFWVVVLNFCTLMLGIFREVTRDLGAGQMWEGAPANSLCAKTAHVSVITNFSVFPPTRICIDRDPVRTVTEWPFVHSVGCGSFMLDATFPRNIEILLVFYLMRSNWRTALMGTSVTLVLLVSISLALGQPGRQLFYFAALHTCVGCVTAVLCYRSTQESRKTWLMVKHVKLAARQSRKSLHTLIPPNVLTRMASHSHDMGILGAEIEHCTVMFVAFEGQGNGQRPEYGATGPPGALLHDDVSAFIRLHSVLLEFDEAVADSKLYKYQHVGEFYIITCTRAAEPFKVVEKSPETDATCRAGGDTPHNSNAADMVSLAVQLGSIARRHGFWLRVGIHSGNAAGAVVGKVRAFYCIYGHTVNTASRLCKDADKGRVNCSQEFMRCLEAERAAGICRPGATLAFQPRGRIHLKGIRHGIDTFSASLGAEQSSRGRLPKVEACADEALFNVDAFWRKGGEDCISPPQRAYPEIAVAEASEQELFFNVDAFLGSGTDVRKDLSAGQQRRKRRRSSGRIDMLDSLYGNLSALSKDADLRCAIHKKRQATATCGGGVSFVWKGCVLSFAETYD